ncbi:MAG: hypothetical protein IPM16_21360 [Chloroflexi bacterium]|nr:hypothetical protein [Chloroflexota bacterium]
MNSAHVVSITIRKAGHAEPVRLHAADLRADHGIVGDEKAGRSPKRNLNVIAAEIHAHLLVDGQPALPGELGEQIILRGLDLSRLPRGAHIAIGPDVVIEITVPRTGCTTTRGVDGPANVHPDQWLGVMARVVRGGRVWVGDSIRVLAVTEAA